MLILRWHRQISVFFSISHHLSKYKAIEVDKNICPLQKKIPVESISLDWLDLKRRSINVYPATVSWIQSLNLKITIYSLLLRLFIICAHSPQLWLWALPQVCPRVLRDLKVILTPLHRWWDFRSLLFSSFHNNSGSTVCFVKWIWVVVTVKLWTFHSFSKFTFVAFLLLGDVLVPVIILSHLSKYAQLDQ